METPREWMKRHREERGMNQDEFADALGVARRTVQFWEAGAHEPRGTSRRKLEVYIGERMPSSVPTIEDEVAAVADRLHDVQECARRIEEKLDALTSRLDVAAQATKERDVGLADVLRQIRDVAAQIHADASSDDEAPPAPQSDQRAQG